MPMSWPTCALAVLGAYMLGSIPIGLLAGRLRGIDIRQFGSGNIGATNAARALGYGWGAGVFCLDVLKGFGPTFWAVHFPQTHGAEVTSLRAQGFLLAVGAAALLGHMFPVFLGFRGGKGAATGLGLLLAINLPAGISAFGVWVFMLGAWQYVSAASMCASFSYPWFCVLAGFLSGTGVRPGWFTWGVTAVLCGLVIARHRSNIGRLWIGTEPRIGDGKKDGDRGDLAVTTGSACEGPG